MVTHQSRTRSIALWARIVATTLLVATAGCGSSGGGRADATRSPERAEAALRTSLEAWKAGRKPAELQAEAPSITVHDSVWKVGRKLAGFEILDRSKGDVRVDFRVRLTLKEPDKEVEQVYYVWGKTPLSVYRQEDFERILATDRP